MKRTRGPMAIALAAVAALALSACAGDGGSAPKGGDDDSPKILAIATMTVPQSLDPKDAMGSAIPFFQATYDTLIKREADGTYAPMLATEWEYNDDRTELTLTLRDDVEFADGTKFDADAVKANLERFREGGGGQAETMGDLEDVTVVDETHAVLHLAQPNPGMEFYLSDAAGLMANPAKFDGETLTTSPDGSGPYTLDESQTVIGTKWVYKHRDNYWGEDLPFQTVTMSVFDNENAIVNGLKTGQINASLLQTADQQIAAESDTALTMTPQEFDFQGIVLFDRAGVLNPALGDVRVRQALNYAIDRGTMAAQILQDRGTATSQIYGTDTAAYDEALDGYYSYDPEKAKSLLADAGYADGLKLTLPIVPGITSDALTSSLRTDFADVGVTLEWSDVDPAQVVKKIFQDKEFAGMVMNIGQSSSDWITTKEMVLPGTFNFFGYSDDVVADLIPKVQTASAEDAAADFAALNKHLVEDAWFIPFYRMVYQHVTDASVNVEPQSGMAVPSLYNYTPAN